MGCGAARAQICLAFWQCELVTQRGWEDLGSLAEGQNGLSLSAESSCPWLFKGQPFL